MDQISQYVLEEQLEAAITDLQSWLPEASPIS